jgi:hypothetical protein
MGDPSNRNQSHLLHGRSTSRVLAPPGGHSSFQIGGYGGAPTDYSTTNRRDAAPAPRRAPAIQAEESYQRRDPPKAYSSREPSSREPPSREPSGRGLSIPGLESHYDDGNRDSNKYASKYSDNVSDNRRQSYSDEDDDQNYNAPSAAPKGMLRSNTGSLSGGDYAAQLKAQIAMKKNIDNKNEANDPYSSRRQGGGGGGGGGRIETNTGGGASYASRSTKAIADSRHDSAMNAYSQRQESDREKDYRRMQNMEDNGPDRGGQRNNNRRDSGYGDNNGSSYKASSANVSGSAPLHTSTRVHAPPGGHSSFQIGWGQ